MEKIKSMIISVLLMLSCQQFLCSDWTPKDYIDRAFDTLGLDVTATKEDITRAYKRLALKYHPDKNQSPDAADKFMKIKDAYDILMGLEGIPARPKQETGPADQSEANTPIVGPKAILVPRTIEGNVKSVKFPTIGDINIQEIIRQAQKLAQNYNGTDIGAFIQENMSKIPYKALGITDLEIRQLKSGTVPASLKNKVISNYNTALTIFNKIEPQLKNLTTVVGLVDYYFLTAVQPQHLTPEILKALHQTNQFISDNKNILTEFGIKLANLIAQNAQLITQNIDLSKLNATSAEQLRQNLMRIGKILEPQVEAAINALNKANPQQLDKLIDAYKAIDYSKINIDGIESDLESFISKNF